MSRVGLHDSHLRRPHLPHRSSSSLLELITNKTIDQIADSSNIVDHRTILDEGVDDFRYPEQSFFAFPQPINTPHTRTRTIRLKMPAAKSKESGVGEKVSKLRTGEPMYADQRFSKMELSFRYRVRSSWQRT